MAVKLYKVAIRHEAGQVRWMVTKIVAASGAAEARRKALAMFGGRVVRVWVA